MARPAGRPFDQLDPNAQDHPAAPEAPIRKTRWAWMVASFFGAGLLRPGPGTYGSVAALVLWYLAARVAHPTSPWLALATALAALAATLIGIPAATIAARESGCKDPGFIVIDEVAGQWIALIAVHPDWRHAALALALFRLFDIWKPWPVRRLEHLPGGTGIVLDDLAAGLFAMAAAVVLGRWF